MTGSSIASSAAFVGRDSEVAALRSTLQSTLGGDTCALVITGEAGIGKTRLLGRLVAIAEEADVPVMVGCCWELDRSSPLAPVAGLLGESSVPGETAEPEVPAALDPRPDGGEHLQRRKRRLFAGLVDELRLALDQSGDRGDAAVLAIEDLHWSDETTLEFLPYLALNLGRPLLLVLTMRPEETGLPVAECLAALERLRLTIDVPLSPMSMEEGTDLVEAVLGDTAPRGEQLRSLLDLADGNPLFIEELARSVGPGALGSRRIDAVRTPRTVAVAVKRQAAMLDPATLRLLEVASVLGRRFELRLLCVVADVEEDAAISMVRELVETRLLVEDGADHLVFRHALIQNAVSGSLLARERARIHEAAAHAITAGARQPAGDELAHLAHHFYEAGDWEQTVVWADRACARARAMYTPRATVELATRAIEAADRLKRPPAPHLLRSRGVANEWLGNYDAARSDHEQALGRAKAAGDRLAEWLSLIDLGALSRERDFTIAGELFSQALVVARGLDDQRALARTLSWIGFWEMMNDDPVAARGHQEEALAIFESIGDDEGIAETLDHLGWTYYVCADLAGSVASYERCSAMKRELDDPQGLASALAGHATRGTDYFQLPSVWPQLDEMACSRDVQAAVRYASEIAWRSGEARALVWASLFLGVRGHYDEAFGAARRGLEIARQDEQLRYHATARIALGALWLDVLRSEEALVDLERAMLLARQMGSPTVVSTTTGLLISALLARGETDRAKAALGARSVDPPVRSMPERLLCCAHVEVALAEEDSEIALVLTDRLVAASPNLTDQTVIPRLWHLRGEALAQMGRWAEAAEAVETAAASAGRLGQRGLQWRILVTGGKIEQLQRRTGRAAELYDRARTVSNSIAASLGDAAERAEFLASVNARIPGFASNAARRQLAAGGLTPRESEVAGLVAQGLTNREIAEQLVLSPRTVEKHVENVLLKLGLRSRVQVAVWVVDHANS